MIKLALVNYFRFELIARICIVILINFQLLLTIFDWFWLFNLLFDICNGAQHRSNLIRFYLKKDEFDHKYDNFNQNLTLIVMDHPILLTDFKWDQIGMTKFLESKFESLTIWFVMANCLSLVNKQCNLVADCRLSIQPQVST